LLPALPVFLFRIYEDRVLNLVLFDFGDNAFELTLILELRRMDTDHLETAIGEVLAIRIPPALVMREITLTVDASKRPEVDDANNARGEDNGFVGV
jgi:hypothetical protein